MKKIISKSAHLLIIALAHLLINTSLAQAPQKMSYQAVIRNTSGALVSSALVGMKISILQGIATVAYSETQTASTNANGLVSLEIGAGTVVSGTFSGINWGNGPYFIKTETDPVGGTNYSITGTSELMSVPYALFSANGATGPQGIQGETGAQGIQGPEGIAGTNGYSAYQVAVENGFIGTEAQWLLSLQVLNGATGPQGIQGETGATGAQGIQGLTGETGAQGIQGETGTTGAEGIQGLTGETGAQGIQGETGPQGIQGETGPQGPQGVAGTNGTNGTNGSSAYQVAVGNGFIGSEAQWLLSLQGLPGAIGAAGTNGTNGNDGATGPQGPQGVAGTNGTNGTNGSNAYQVAVGNGFIGTEAQWLLSLQGLTGPAGTFPPGTVAGEMNYWNGAAWVTVAPGSNNQNLTFCNGVPTWGPCPLVVIGQSYQGGKVAYILQASDPGYNATVQHGLIAAPSDQGTGIPWGCSATAISGADGTAIGTGNQNTIDIMNGCATAGIAARLCGDLVLGGYSDWYLPSKDELNKLRLNRVAIGGFATNVYWSSTEGGNSVAWAQLFDLGTQGNGGKDYDGNVRAVRAF